MGNTKSYFPLTLDTLRSLGGWAAECAERALPLFERCAPGDARPRTAIAGIREFAAGGRRTAQLRVLALAALSAAREVGKPAAAAAARAAGIAASTPYTHPLADAQQTKHILAPAAYAALAFELEGGNETIGEAELRRAVDSVPAEVRDLLLHMPARPPGKNRADRLMALLDAGMRAPSIPGEV